MLVSVRLWCRSKRDNLKLFALSVDKCIVMPILSTGLLLDTTEIFWFLTSTDGDLQKSSGQLVKKRILAASANASAHQESWLCGRVKGSFSYRNVAGRYRYE
jgi:hypothetical protein